MAYSWILQAPACVTCLSGIFWLFFKTKWRTAERKGTRETPVQVIHSYTHGLPEMLKCHPIFFPHSFPLLPKPCSDPSGRIIESWVRQLHFNCPRRGHRGGRGHWKRGQWKGNKALKIHSFPMRRRRMSKSQKVRDHTLPAKSPHSARKTWEKQGGVNWSVWRMVRNLRVLCQNILRSSEPTKKSSMSLKLWGK